MSTALIIGLACWVAIVAMVLALVRAAALADRHDERHAETVAPETLLTPVLPPTEPPGRRRRRRLTAAELLAVAIVAALAVRASEPADWTPLALTGLLTVLAVAGDLQAFRARRFRISASFPALVVAMALLGPAPAVAIGAACALADAVFSRPRIDQLASNLLAYMLPALLGAMVLEWAGVGGDNDATLPVVLLVMAVYALTTALNFLLIAGHTALLARGGLRAMIRSELVPMLPWEAGAAALAGVAVYVYGVRGEAGLAVLAVAGIAFQWLLRAVVESERRGTEIQRQGEQLEVRTEGMISLVLQLLELREPAFTRHAAAVAHHARALAEAAGLSEHEQEVVHAAGLLHDIGHQAFDDMLLAGDRPVDEEGRRAIRRHPIVGANLLRGIPGLWEVAEAVETHHEHVDGSGYPHGLTSSRIPRAARIVAIAEVFDVLTADDSYRGHRDHEWVARELRRVAGTQLDSRLVEVFLTAVPHEGARPQLEEELPVLQRAIGLRGPRPTAG